MKTGSVCGKRFACRIFRCEEFSLDGCFVDARRGYRKDRRQRADGHFISGAGDEGNERGLGESAGLHGGVWLPLSHVTRGKGKARTVQGRGGNERKPHLPY